MKYLIALFYILCVIPCFSQEVGPPLTRARVMPLTQKTNAITRAKERSKGTVGLMNKLSRDTVGVTTLHQLEVTGKDVVLCVVDKGIDFNHEAFTDSLGISHVQRAMIYSAQANDSLWNDDHTEWRWNYILAQTPEEIAALGTDSYKDVHGTHTSASAGGARRKAGTENAEYYGMAPDADLFLVGNPGLSTEYTLDAFHHAREYAKSVGKPLVCSYSVGSIFFPLDTLEYWPQALRKFTEDGNAKGLAVCVSAGNSGSNTNKLSVHWDFSYSDTLLVHKTVLGHSEIKDNRVDYSSCYSMFYDITDRDFEFQVSIMDANRDTVVWQSDIFSTCVENERNLMEDTPFANCGTVNLSSGTDPDNHLKCAYIESVDFSLPYYTSNDSLPTDTCYVLTVTIKGERGGFIEGKSYPNSQYGEGFYSGTEYMSGYEEGDALNALNGYCTNPWCISVGASDATVPDGDIAAFTGFGYDFYGNPYPEVLAPGVDIVSAVNRYAVNPNDLSVHPFDVGSGTSMSTPITAGVIACWMQEYPQLTIRQIHDILSRTSYIDPTLASLQKSPSRYGKGTIQGKAGWDAIREMDPLSLKNVINRQKQVSSYRLDGTKTTSETGLIIRDNKVLFVK